LYQSCLPAATAGGHLKDESIGAAVTILGLQCGRFMRRARQLDGNCLMRRLLARCAAFLLLLNVISVPAVADAPSLYQAHVAVAGQDPKSLQQGLSQALAQVVVKVGGQKSLLQQPAVAAAMRDPNRFVLQFGYEAGTKSGAPQMLAASFQPEAIKQLLRGSGLPIWPENRPVVLVWLLVDDGGERGIVAGERRPEIAQQLKEAAQARGIELRLPLGDTEDKMAIGENELWQLQRSAVEHASARYGNNTILYGRLAINSAGHLQGNWQLLHLDALRGFDGAGNEVAQYLQNGIDSMADWLATKYAVTTQTGGGGAVTLVVENIDSYPQYAAALNYLQKLEAISHVSVQQAHGSEVQFAATVSDMTQFDRIIALDHRLEPLAADAAAATVSHRYRWSEVTP